MEARDASSILIVSMMQEDLAIWQLGGTGSAASVLARQGYSTIQSICHPYYLSFILYHANIVPLRRSLASQT